MSGVGKAFNKVMNVFGMGVPETSKLEDPKAAPDVDDKSRQAGMERDAMRRRQGRGRTGTILSESDKLG
jgi:hypothetical protein